MRIQQSDLTLVYDRIVRAAAHSLPCPSNGELADWVGAGSVATGSRMLQLLERRGLIRVARFACGREVTVLRTGQTTASVPGSRNPHFSISRTKGPVRPRVAPAPAIAAMPAPPATRVDRDPCWRCGVRADVGCDHQPAGTS